MLTYRATAVYPYDNAERATSAFRGALRLQIPSDQAPDWSTLQVTGPEKRVDARGRVWFEYRATATATRSEGSVA